MTSSRSLILGLVASGTLIALSPSQGAAQSGRVQIMSQDIEAAQYAGGDLPSGQSALTAKVQILLDRSGVSPGVVDGFKGGMSESAILAFERGHGLPMDGMMDPTIWQLLHAHAAAPMTMDYTITEADAQDLVDHIPTDYAEKAAMETQGYTSVVERLAERFHMDDKFLAQLNPAAAFVPGETIRVTVPAKPLKAKVARILIDKDAHRVAAYDAAGRMVVDYPATIGSDATPSPHGTHSVTAIALNPTYTYDPNKNFKQGDNDKVLVVPPGPNGPVGNVWIDLSQPTYGIHGTATPSRLFVQESHGCVRLTNWDAQELAHMVQPGTTIVEFLPPGVRIADVAGAAATIVGSAAAGTASQPDPQPLTAAADATGPLTGTDAAVAQALASGVSASGAMPAADSQAADAPVLLGAQRPGMNPLRRAAMTATTTDPSRTATDGTDLPPPAEAAVLPLDQLSGSEGRTGMDGQTTSGFVLPPAATQLTVVPATPVPANQQPVQVQPPATYTPQDPAGRSGEGLQMPDTPTLSR
ncbi:L,D-transpeptidase family protein [uncultured Paracoccus sp.]|uniref:L,D-transpeptidase family protein n=1 Tax=uncultured Paracoccus sp. TaxID=189685 RepID=UPI002603BB78|nr:L,D-transpeptidase family protein [uncultured Paracoccus sp.]